MPSLTNKFIKNILDFYRIFFESGN
jgi:hypothetical protein